MDALTVKNARIIIDAWNRCDGCDDCDKCPIDVFDCTQLYEEAVNRLKASHKRTGIDGLRAEVIGLIKWARPFEFCSWDYRDLVIDLTPAELQETRRELLKIISEEGME